MELEGRSPGLSLNSPVLQGLHLCFILSFSCLVPCSISALVISCFVTNYLKTYWLKTTTTIQYPSEVCRLTGLSWGWFFCSKWCCWGCGSLQVVCWGCDSLQVQMSQGPWLTLPHGRRLVLAVDWESPLGCQWTPECSFMQVLSLWLGLLSAWRLDYKSGHYKYAKAKVTRRLKARAQKSWMTIPTAFCWSKHSQGQLSGEGKQTWKSDNLQFFFLFRT